MAKGKKTTILSKYVLDESPKENPQEVKKSHREVYVDQRLFSGLEKSIGQSKVKTVDDVKNISIWVGRLLGTEIYNKIGQGNQEVPRERVKAVTCINPDYKELAKLNIPVIVLSGTQEIFFPNNQVRETMQILGKKYPYWPGLLISSNIAHEEPHNNPKGTAYVIETMRQKFFQKHKIQALEQG